jgi:hypothetical protein
MALSLSLAPLQETNSPLSPSFSLVAVECEDKREVEALLRDFLLIYRSWLANM